MEKLNDFVTFLLLYKNKNYLISGYIFIILQTLFIFYIRNLLMPISYTIFYKFLLNNSIF